MKYVTLRDIAAKAGVSVGTVSFSLHGNPMIPLATRKRILALTKDMGYELDPRLATAMSFIRRRKPKQSPSVIAMLVARTPEQAALERKIPRYELCFEVTRRRAQELGYNIEILNVGSVHSPAFSPARLQTILETRAIRGVLLPPLGIHPPVLPADLDKFSFSEGMDRGLPPFFSGAEPAVFQNTMLAMRELHALGHRRVGVYLGGLLFVPETLAAYRHSAVELGWPIIKPYHRVDYNSDGLAAWLTKEKPTVVYSNFYGLHTLLTNLGLRIPQDLSVALSEATHHDLKVDISGIDDQPELMFETMVDLLVEQMNRGLTGLPQVRRRTELLGHWHPGETLRAQDGASRANGWTAFVDRTRRPGAKASKATKIKQAKHI
jgi:LacI family transcriptional regulator